MRSYKPHSKKSLSSFEATQKGGCFTEGRSQARSPVGLSASGDMPWWTRDNVSMEGSIGEPLLNADEKAAWWASSWFVWAVVWFIVEPFERAYASHARIRIAGLRRSHARRVRRRTAAAAQPHHATTVAQRRRRALEGPSDAGGHGASISSEALSLRVDMGWTQRLCVAAVSPETVRLLPRLLTSRFVSRLFALFGVERLPYCLLFRQVGHLHRPMRV